MTQIAFPLQIDNAGRTATADRDRHIRDMIEQVLFTAPGERVNRPDFGCGILKLLFGGNSPEIATATQFLVQGALQQWLGDLIQVQDVTVESAESTVRVTVSYVIKEDQTRQAASFSREV
jgi:phage baseplate assembly protein W